MFELACRAGPQSQSISVADISAVQAIPPRFLNLILGELRQGGFVESRRGARGGYLLASSPAAVTVGDIICFVDGPITPVNCIAGESGGNCQLWGKCAFLDMWRRARQAVTEVYDSTSLQNLVDDWKARENNFVADYCI
jgi:Rrf2 family protein